MATNSSSIRKRPAKNAATPRRARKEPSSRNRPSPAARFTNPDDASTAENVSSADQIAAEIVRGLYAGRYVAGQKLIESDLTRRFDVGRGTVREALRRLAAEGYVTMSLHRGASIRAINRADVRDMLDVLECLCGLSARRAAEELSDPEDENALRMTMKSLSAPATTGDTFEFARMRNRFYGLLVRISGNRELARLLSMVNVHLIRIQFRDAYTSQKERVDTYQKITDAVLARDGARAERVMRQHIRATARAIEHLPDHEFDA